MIYLVWAGNHCFNIWEFFSSFLGEGKRKSHSLHGVTKPVDGISEVTCPWENQQDFNLLFYIQVIANDKTYKNELLWHTFDCQLSHKSFGYIFVLY